MPNNENRGRRVTDRSEDLLDTTKQALRIQQAEHNHELLAQRVTSGMENVQNALGDTNRILRGMSEKVSEFAKLQHSHESHREAVARIEESVGSLRATMEEWFETFDERSREKWEAHESKNDSTKEQLEAKINAVRETALTIRTIGAVIALLGGGIIGGFLWTINSRFDDEKAARLENREVINKLVENQVDIKLYLARGGRIPEEPYIPPSQRSKPDEQPKPANHTGQP